jgi:oligopeptide/dipeptide ABC transporter ATP-binding protein
MILDFTENRNPVPGASPGHIPLLKIQGLCKDFPSGGFRRGSIHAVDNVDMELSCGEILGIVGESGSGKTTLARCCLWLIEPSSGTVQFDGQDLAALNPASLRSKRREFQMVFQDSYASLNPAMTVEEILSEPLQVHKIGTREEQLHRVRELVEAVSLSAEIMKRRPGDLSGGQQQRVGLARGLALKPRLLIADEPVSSLDASVQVQILNLLADLKKRYALTLILISHSLYAVHYLCSRVSVMYRGRIVEEAPSAAFFEKPKHPYSRVLLDSMPTLDPVAKDRAYASRESGKSLTNTGSYCAFHPYCPRALPVCKELTPHLTEISPREKVACFLYS